MLKLREWFKRPQKNVGTALCPWKLEEKDAVDAKSIFYAYLWGKNLCAMRYAKLNVNNIKQLSIYVYIALSTHICTSMAF